MDLFLIIAFLFFMGACLGWVLEFLFRNLISHKGPRGKYFINPGFCSGPWLPIYGIGLSVMCLISHFVSVKNPDANAVVVILIIALVMNIIEFIGGWFLLKVLNMRLWDYRNLPGNIMGIVCPLFALIWTGISAVYYLLLHEKVMRAIGWFSDNLAFSFIVGLFWGLFIIDYVTSAYRAKIIKEFADDHDVIVMYEDLKMAMQKHRKDHDEKSKFFNQATSTNGGVKGALEEIGDMATLDIELASHSLRRKNKEKTENKEK